LRAGAEKLEQLSADGKKVIRSEAADSTLFVSGDVTVASAYDRDQMTTGFRVRNVYSGKELARHTLDGAWTVLGQSLRLFACVEKRFERGFF